VGRNRENPNRDEDRRCALAKPGQEKPGAEELANGGNSLRNKESPRNLAFRELASRSGN